MSIYKTCSKGKRIVVMDNISVIAWAYQWEGGIQDCQRHFWNVGNVRIVIEVTQFHVY